MQIEIASSDGPFLSVSHSAVLYCIADEMLINIIQTQKSNRKTTRKHYPYSTMLDRLQYALYGNLNNSTKLLINEA